MVLQVLTCGYAYRFVVLIFAEGKIRFWGFVLGSAELNIWITQIGNPCKIDSRTWFVNIYDCDGRILEWCGRRYVIKEAKCGHLETEVPPGCYLVNAVWGYWIDPRGVIHGNHFTHNAVARACCDETICLTLFNPTDHTCGVIFQLAARDLVAQDILPKNVAERLNAAINEALKYMPRPVKEFELGILEELDELAKKRARQDKPME